MSSSVVSAAAPTTSAESEHAKEQVDDLFSPLFDNVDGKADIVLRSCDGVKFAVQRVLLEATSTVFDDMLAIPQPPTKRQRTSSTASATDALTVVQLAEEARPLEVFLRYVHPQAYLHHDSPPSFASFRFSGDITLLEDVLEIATKFDASFVLDVVASLHIPVLSRLYPLYGWVIACKFDRLDLAQAAIRHLADISSSMDDPNSRRWEASLNTWLLGRRDYCIGDIPLEHLEKLPISSIRNFSAVHAKVVGCQNGAYTWVQAADDFEL